MATEAVTKTREITQTPPQYKVLLLNDDYTPMDFVLLVLMRFFRKSETEAAQTMLEAHEQGVSVAGIYPFEVAETKVSQVLRAAKKEGHPLQVTLEPE